MCNLTMLQIWRIVWSSTSPHRPPIEPRDCMSRALKSNPTKHRLDTFPVMLNVLLEEDLGMFLPVCVSLFSLRLHRAPCHRKGLILIPPKLLWDSIMQDNANTESFISDLLPTHTHTQKRIKKTCQLEQHCLTQLFGCFLLICTFSELAPSLCC